MANKVSSVNYVRAKLSPIIDPLSIFQGELKSAQKDLETVSKELDAMSGKSSNANDARAKEYPGEKMYFVDA
jgi:DNA anti-recombination protein RmuC